MGTGIIPHRHRNSPKKDGEKPREHRSASCCLLNPSAASSSATASMSRARRSPKAQMSPGWAVGATFMGSQLHGETFMGCQSQVTAGERSQDRALRCFALFLDPMFSRCTSRLKILLLF